MRAQLKLMRRYYKEGCLELDEIMAIRAISLEKAELVSNQYTDSRFVYRIGTIDSHPVLIQRQTYGDRVAGDPPFYGWIKNTREGVA